MSRRAVRRCETETGRVGTLDAAPSGGGEGWEQSCARRRDATEVAMRGSTSLGLVGLLLTLIAGSRPSEASVIEPVSLRRSVEASGRVTDLVSGTEVVDPGQSFSSDDPSLTLQLTANASATLSGATATASARSGTVSQGQLPDYLGEPAFELRLTTNAEAHAGTSPNFASTAFARSTLELTFDLTQPIDVFAFFADGNISHPSRVSMTLLSGGNVIARGEGGSPPFQLAPGRYTLVTEGIASASVDSRVGVFLPASFASFSGFVGYTVIPEPATAPLMLAGLALLARSRRR
jgi:hypothetical protein